MGTEKDDWFNARAERATLSPRSSEAERELSRRIGTMEVRAGGYVLAKDMCSWYTGPGWVPFNLYQTAEYGGNHPLERECASVLIAAAGSQALWERIARRYGRNRITGEPSHSPSAIAFNLPVACANAKASWLAIPRMTPSEFKSHREKLARRAEQLALELETFYLPRDENDCEFPGMFDFFELMTPEETDRLDQAIRVTAYLIDSRARAECGAPALTWDEYNAISSTSREMGFQNEHPHRSGYLATRARQGAHDIYALLQRDHTRPDLPYGGVPTLPDMLRRIANKFSEDGRHPPIKSPNLGTAERSHFARELCKYFWRSYGDVSPSIIRDIVTVFYDGGITEGNVSQIIAATKAANPLPDEP